MLTVETAFKFLQGFSIKRGYEKCSGGSLDRKKKKTLGLEVGRIWTKRGEERRITKHQDRHKKRHYLRNQPLKNAVTVSRIFHTTPFQHQIFGRLDFSGHLNRIKTAAQFLGMERRRPRSCVYKTCNPNIFERMENSFSCYDLYLN